MAPNWYDTGASKSKKRKLSSSTKDLEKRKKAATSVDAEDGECPLQTVSKLWPSLTSFFYMFVLTNLHVSAYRGKPTMPKLRSNLKIAAGRGKPPRSPPAAAPTTPTVGVPVVLC